MPILWPHRALTGLPVCVLPSLTRVVHTGLGAVVQGETGGGRLAPQLFVHVLGQHLGHVVVVLGEVRVLLLNFEVEFEVVVGVTERHDCVHLCARMKR